MTLIEWLAVAATTGFSTLCAEYAKDLKKYINAKLRKYYKRESI